MSTGSVDTLLHKELSAPSVGCYWKQLIGSPNFPSFSWIFTVQRKSPAAGTSHGTHISFHHSVWKTLGFSFFFISFTKRLFINRPNWKGLKTSFSTAIFPSQTIIVYNTQGKFWKEKKDKKYFGKVPLNETFAW